MASGTLIFTAAILGMGMPQAEPSSSRATGVEQVTSESLLGDGGNAQASPLSAPDQIGSAAGAQSAAAQLTTGQAGQSTVTQLSRPDDRKGAPPQLTSLSRSTVTHSALFSGARPQCRRGPDRWT